MRNNNEMMRACRRAMSAVAGADSKTLRSVADMRMRSEESDSQNNRNIVNSLMSEHEKASADFNL